MSRIIIVIIAAAVAATFVHLDGAKGVSRYEKAKASCLPNVVIVPWENFKKFKPEQRI